MHSRHGGLLCFNITASSATEKTANEKCLPKEWELKFKKKPESAEL